MRFRRTLASATAALALLTAGCGNPTDPTIVYKKLTPEEFAKLPPEEQETPEVKENMGALWKDPNNPKTATNPKRRR
ncbi:oxidoreductase [Isosphaeraceae bacterium EP7]